MDIVRVRELCSEARAADARGDGETALSTAEAALALAPSDEGPHYGRGMALVTLAWIKAHTGQLDAAKNAAIEALTLARQLVDEDFENAAVIATQCLRLELAAGRMPSAELLAEELLAWHAAALGPDHLRMHQCRAELEGLGLVAMR